MINLKIKIPHDMSETQFQGMFLSFLTAVEDVALKRRKATYIQHFFRERLDRREKRTLRSALGQIQSQLVKSEINKNPEVVTANLSETRIPDDFLHVIKSFQNIRGIK